MTLKTLQPSLPPPANWVDWYILLSFPIATACSAPLLDSRKTVNDAVVLKPFGADPRGDQLDHWIGVDTVVWYVCHIMPVESIAKASIRALVLTARTGDPTKVLPPGVPP